MNEKTNEELAREAATEIARQFKAGGLDIIKGSPVENKTRTYIPLTDIILASITQATAASERKCGELERLNKFLIADECQFETKCSDASDEVGLWCSTCQRKHEIEELEKKQFQCICVFCKKEFSKDSPDLPEHILTCDKSPLVKLIKDAGELNESLLAQLAAAEKQIAEMGEAFRNIKSELREISKGQPETWGFVAMFLDIVEKHQALSSRQPVTKL